MEKIFYSNIVYLFCIFYSSKVLYISKQKTCDFQTCTAKKKTQTNYNYKEGKKKYIYKTS